jgi:hypothetical protein
MNRNEMIMRSFQILALVLLAAFPAISQEPRGEKFKLAPPGCKAVGTDRWEVTFDLKLSDVDFDREIQSILKKYRAKALSGDRTLGAFAIFPGARSALIKVSMKKARQIATETFVTEVRQECAPEIHYNTATKKNEAADGELARRIAEGGAGDQAADLTPEDEAILDKVWIGSRWRR